MPVVTFSNSTARRDMSPFDVLTEVKRRSAEAVIAQSGLSHDGLRRHLRALLGGNDPSAGALFADSGASRPPIPE